MSVASYMHSFRFRRQLTMAEWSTVVRVANEVIHHCPMETVEGEPLYGELLTQFQAGDPTKHAVVSHTMCNLVSHRDGLPFITLNGIKGKDGDVFELGMDAERRLIDTKRQPYNFVVMAILIGIDNKLPDLLHLDMTFAVPTDWEIAMVIANNAFKGLTFPAWTGVHRSGVSEAIQRPTHMDFRA